MIVITPEILDRGLEQLRRGAEQEAAAGGGALRDGAGRAAAPPGLRIDGPPYYHALTGAAPMPIVSPLGWMIMNGTDIEGQVVVANAYNPADTFALQVYCHNTVPQVKEMIIRKKAGEGQHFQLDRLRLLHGHIELLDNTIAANKIKNGGVLHFLVHIVAAATAMGYGGGDLTNIPTPPASSHADGQSVFEEGAGIQRLDAEMPKELQLEIENLPWAEWTKTSTTQYRHCWAIFFGIGLERFPHSTPRGSTRLPELQAKLIAFAKSVVPSLKFTAINLNRYTRDNESMGRHNDRDLPQYPWQLDCIWGDFEGGGTQDVR